MLPLGRVEYLGGVVFFGDKGGELDAEALHVLPPVARAASPPFRCRTATAAPINIHPLSRSGERAPPQRSENPSKLKERATIYINASSSFKVQQYRSSKKKKRSSITVYMKHVSFKE
jgi:hypothetical protein